MAKIKLQVDGMIIEADMTVDELKEFVGHNDQKRTPQVTPTSPMQVVPTQLKLPDFVGFRKIISERGEMMLDILGSSPDGIDAHDLASLLGYSDPRQIGGLTGGGLAKAAKKTGVKLKDVYTKKITFPEGKRTVTFYPGKLVLGMTEHKKPA